MPVQHSSLAKIDEELASPNEHTRWQAAIALGDFVFEDPECIRTLTVKHGSSEDEDVRMAIATCVLEHILEHHFVAFFPRVRDIVHAGNRQFADTFTHCWEMMRGVHPEYARQWRFLKREARKLLAA